MIRLKRSLLFALAAGTVAGCGPSGPKMVEVSGTVKYDGKDVDAGEVIFIPADKTLGPEGGKIAGGKYTLKVKEGMNAVKVTANRTVPGKKGPMGEDWLEQYIPGKYNEKTELSADTAAKVVHNFDLTK